MPKKIESTPPPHPRIIRIFDAASRALEKILHDEELVKKNENQINNKSIEQPQEEPKNPDKK